MNTLYKVATLVFKGSASDPSVSIIQRCILGKFTIGVSSEKLCSLNFFAMGGKFFFAAISSRGQRCKFTFESQMTIFMSHDISQSD